MCGWHHKWFTYHGTLSIASTFITVSIILSAIYIMRVFLVYVHVTSVEGRDLYIRIPCNRLFRDNTKVLDKLDLAQTPLSITISLMSSEITLPVKDATTPTVENQLCRLRKLTTAKPLMTSQISRDLQKSFHSHRKKSQSPQYDQQPVQIQHSLTVVDLQTFNH